MADDLATILREGSGYVYAAHGICSLDEVPPVGKVPPGSSLQKFWHLGVPQIEGWHHLFIAPPQRPNTDREEVNSLLQVMMSIRRMSKQQVSALADRVSQLPAKMGRSDGGFAAATLLSRMQQALSEPTAYPGLLTNAELGTAYKEANGLASMMGIAADADSSLATAAVGAGTLARLIQRMPGIRWRM